jgi:FkbM family methyltransferase
MFVLDVGANIGYFSALAAGLVGARGSVHAFEPLPESFARLRRNLAAFNWAHAHLLAVSDVSGKTSLFSSDRAEEAGWATLLPSSEFGSAREVDVVSLDEWMERQQPQHVDFIKLDIEGGEYRALKGAETLLRRYKPVVVAELNAEWLLRDSHNSSDVVDVLRSLEYKTFTFNDGVLAIPNENDEKLAELAPFGEKPAL